MIFVGWSATPCAQRFSRIAGMRKGQSHEWRMTAKQRTATKAASDGDRDWFARNLHRSHRLRRALPNEVEAMGASPDKAAGAWVVVRQVEPGLRIRTPFMPPSPPPDDEILGALLFDLLAEHGAAGAKHVPMSEIEALWRQVAPAGRA
jgi:hypothetical protein